MALCAGRYLLLGLAVLPLPGLLLDVCDHGEGRAVVAISQVDDVGDGREHGALAAGPDGRALLTHGQEELVCGREDKPGMHAWCSGVWTPLTPSCLDQHMPMTPVPSSLYTLQL